MQVKEVLRKKNKQTKKQETEIKERSKRDILYIKCSGEVSLWRSYLSCKLEEGKKLSPKGIEGRAVPTEGTARVSGLGWGNLGS